MVSQRRTPGETEKLRPTFWQWLTAMPDYPKFQAYQQRGGGLSYNQWKKQGEPSPPTALSAYGAAIGARQEPGTIVAPITPGETVSIAKRQALQALGQVGGETIGIGMPVRYETITENGWQYSIGYDNKGNIVSRDPLGRVETPPSTAVTPYQQAQLTYQQQQDAQAQANWQAQQAWQQQQATQQQAWQQQQLAQERQQQQEQLGWYRQQAQMQQAEQERQYRSQLAASPMSWLQYASYTGEQPVIQPWMLPLMPQQYAGTTAGEQIPGWQAGGSMTALPGLTTPSAQYWARMGPTAQQQYMGYQQGQGGIRPEETQFRLQSQSPPKGRNYGLTWSR